MPWHWRHGPARALDAFHPRASLTATLHMAARTYKLPGRVDAPRCSQRRWVDDRARHRIEEPERGPTGEKTGGGGRWKIESADAHVARKL